PRCAEDRSRGGDVRGAERRDRRVWRLAGAVERNACGVNRSGRELALLASRLPLSRGLSFRLPSGVFGQLAAARLTIPFLERLRGDLPFDEQLSEFAPLGLALERHPSIMSCCRRESRQPRTFQGRLRRETQ